MDNQKNDLQTFESKKSSRINIFKIIKQFISSMSKASTKTIISILIVFLVLIIGLYYCFNSIGKAVGTTLGTAAGRALGSFNGISTGLDEGMKEGKESGLSAEDIIVSVSKDIQEMENLEVLIASVKLSDLYSIGENKDYAVLYLLKGDVIFSVDLKKADIQYQNNEIYITVPMPEAKLYISEEQTKKIAEYQRDIFNGDTESGYKAAMNSIKKIHEAGIENISNYYELFNSAKKSAVQQITNIAQSASIGNKTISVSFIEEGN